MTAPSAFELFCAYHLGLDRQGKFRFMHRREVAKDLGLDVDQLDAALAAHGLTPEEVLARDFDLGGAQLDLQVSPPGVDLVGLAEMHWQCFLQAGPRPPDDEGDDDVADAMAREPRNTGGETV